MKVLFRFLFLLLILFTIPANSQNFQEYLGILKLNDSSLISYQLNLTEIDGIISGFSVTDLGGNHETKSNIIGSYNNDSDLLSFREVGIIYTKSTISDYDFCYVHFEGKMNNINSNKNIDGKFNGRYNDGSTCINGEIMLKNVVKIEKKATRIDKTIQKSKRISAEVKSKVNLTQTLDSLKMNILKTGQNLSMFSSEPVLNLKIYDAGKVDGDRITIMVNDSVILRNYEVSKIIKHLKIPLIVRNTKVQVKAINTGSISPNTARIEIIDQKNTIDVITSLKKGEYTSITIIKEE
jgi:hypothetical protein